MDAGNARPIKKLRDYQEAALNKINERFEAGVTRQLFSAATGAGKTECFAFLIKQRIAEGGNALILAHRDRLTSQAADRVRGIVGWGHVGLVNGDRKEWYKPIVSATVQSAASEKQLERAPKFSTIIIDEAHRANSPSYRKVIDKLLAPGGLLLGVTATPNRTDKKGLIPDVFQELVFEIGMQELIDKEYLCPVIGTEIKLPIDLSSLRTQIGTDGIKDFRADDVMAAFEQANWLQAITAGWKEVASDRRTIVFVPPGVVDGRGCGMAHSLAEYMRLQGIRAAAVDGNTPQPEQDRIIEDFTAGRIQVLCNVNIFTEGLDIPPIDCVLFARLTLSSIVYSQSIGRGTRIFPGKQNCLVIDITGMTQTLAAQGQTLMTLGKVLPTKEQKECLANERLKQARALIKKIRKAGGDIWLEGEGFKTKGEIKRAWQRQLDDLREEIIIALEEEQSAQEEEEREKENRPVNASLLQHDGTGIQARVMDPGKAGLEFNWHFDIPNRTATIVHRGQMWKIERPSPEGPYICTGPQWRATWPDSKRAKDAVERRIADLELEMRRRQLEEKRNNAIFNDPRAKWRQKPASDAQKALALKLWIQLPENCTAGQASELIDAKMAKRKRG